METTTMPVSERDQLLQYAERIEPDEMRRGLIDSINKASTNEQIANICLNGFSIFMHLSKKAKERAAAKI